MTEQTEKCNAQRLEAWIRLYSEELTYARQHEVLRTSSATLIAAATGGVLALFASQATLLEQRSWPAGLLAAFVAAINLLGWGIGKKHYERTRRHQAIAQCVPEGDIRKLPSRPQR